MADCAESRCHGLAARMVTVCVSSFCLKERIAAVERSGQSSEFSFENLRLPPETNSDRISIGRSPAMYPYFD